MTERKELIIEPSSRFSLNINELWQYKELFYFFTWRDIKVKYKQTVLGIIWVVIQPILTVAVFSIFFGRVLNKDMDVPYPVFVFSGLLLWNVFSSGISTASNSMLTNGPIIKKIYFPRLIIPISSIMVTTVDFIVAFVAFIITLLYFQIHVNFLMLLIFWPVSISLTLLGTIGISLWLAALNVKYRDFRYIVPFVLQIALFVSPVIYPTSSFQNHVLLNIVLALNPMYAAITLFRAPFSSAVLQPALILISVFSIIISLIVGVYYFRKTEAYFADIA